jgi:hypothetical protein
MFSRLDRVYSADTHETIASPLSVKRRVTVGMPVEERTDIVVRVGDKAVNRDDAVQDDGAHGVLLQSPVGIL